MSIRILSGDVRAGLARLDAGSVQVCITSPPYYRLRKYLPANHPDAVLELGSEETPEAYVAAIVDVFRGVWRVLRDDGTCVVNLGDGYSGSGKGPTGFNGIGDQNKRQGFDTGGTRISPDPSGLPAKNLLEMPSRFALAMQASGWILRSRMPWIKASSLPESVRDRPSNALEYVFLFSKRARYYWDGFSIRRGAEKLDESRHNTIQYEHGNESLQDLSTRSTTDGFLPSKESDGVRGDVSGLYSGANEGPSSDSRRSGSIKASRYQVSPEQAGDGEEEGIRKVRFTQGQPETLFSDPERQGRNLSEQSHARSLSASVPLLLFGQGQDYERPLSTDGKRESLPSARRSQAAGKDADREQIDSRRVDGDQERSQSEVFLLPSNGDSFDDGSSDSLVEGRSPREGEHRPGLPLVQCEEGEPPASQSNAPPRLAAEGRSFRNTDLFHDTLTLRIADLRAELAHLETIQRDGGLLADANGDPLALLVNPEPLSAKRLNNGYGETVATEHYAAFPSELPRIFIRAATSEAGCCRACGSPYVREVERTAMVIRRTDWGEKAGNRTAASGTMLEPATAKTTGWSPSCQCKAGPPRPCLVLDPFLGSGTTLLVAQELGRDGVGLELSADYVELARRRIVGASPLLADVTVEGVEA